jgi:predicted MPP superfamily phosphohydrolase
MHHLTVSYKQKIIIYLSFLIVYLLKLLSYPLRVAFPAKLQVDKYKIKAPKLAPQLHGFKIVHLTDFHCTFELLKTLEILSKLYSRAIPIGDRIEIVLETSVVTHVL